MANTLKFGNGEWYGKEGTILAYNDENNNYKPLPFSFSRAGAATRVNKDGLIETVGSGIPRVDYKDDSNGALLLEPSRTNKISTSNDFNGSGWLVSNITATANQVVSPDGTLNASKLEMTGNGSLRNQSEASFNDGYAYSIFVKKGNSRYVTIRSAFFTQSIVVGFDLDTLTAQTDGKIEDYGNDWYRLSISKNINGDADRSGFFYLYLPNSLGSQTSVSGNYVYAYGAQIEEGSYPTSYIPTSGSAVTRVYDTMPSYLDVTPLNIGNSYTLFLDADLNVNDNNKVFGVTSNSSNLTSFTFRNNAGGIRLYNHIDGSYPVKGITSSTNKFVIRVDGNSYKVFVQGSSLSGTLTTQRDLGSLNFYGQNTELKINNFTIDDTALSDAECEALTS